MHRTAIAAFLVALAAFFALVAVPWLGDERDFPGSISSPAPRASLAIAEVAGGERLCLSEVTLDPQSQVARFRIGTFGRAGAPLTLDLRAPGYSFSRRIPGGYADNEQLSVLVDPPRSPTLGSACIRNDGGAKVAVYAAGDEVRSRVAVTPERPRPTFGFWESEPRSIAERASLTAERVARFRGPLGHTWVVWASALLAFLSLSAGLVALLAFTRSSSNARR